ncbi:MAG: ThuA domain-containing protein [Gemmatimonadota bacterium]
MRHVLVSSIALALLATAGHGQTPAGGKQIVFLAGPRDHGAPGRHEYEKDLRVLAYGFDHASNLPGVTTKVIVGKAPRNLAELENASVLVIESSSDRAANEIHPLFPPDPTTNHTGYDAETKSYLAGLDSLIKRKHIGIVIIHYASWVENWAARAYYIDWTGGLWVQMMSKNPNDQWAIALRNESHPILRGVKPWSYRDEIFSRYFLPDDPKRTDLLVGTPARATIGPQVVSWAYQRADGGRGFVMGGVDYHDNMKLEDYRRFLLNGIAWAAGIDVPAGGIVSSLPAETP